RLVRAIGQSAGRGDELLAGDRLDAFGQLRGVQVPPDGDVSVDDPGLLGRAFGVAEGTRHRASHPDVIELGQAAVAVGIEVVETPAYLRCEEIVRHRAPP